MSAQGEAGACKPDNPARSKVNRPVLKDLCAILGIEVV
jgi:hypothetical protein